MIKKSMKKAVAMMLAFGLMISAASVSVAAETGEQGEKTVLSPAEQFAEVSINSYNDLINYTDDTKILIKDRIFSDDSDNMVLNYAQSILAKKNNKIKINLVSFDGAEIKDMFVFYPDGKLELYAPDPKMLDGETVKPKTTIKNVKELRKVSGQKFAVKIVKGKKTSYVTYSYVNRSLTKKTTYSKDKKTYKKNSKKTTKKKYNSYVKKYKKLKKISVYKLGSSAVDKLYKDIITYKEKNLLVYGGDHDSFVFKADNDEKIPFKLFTDYGNTGVRVILGSTDIDKNTGKCYMQLDWEFALKLFFKQLYFGEKIKDYPNDYKVVLYPGESGKPDRYVITSNEEGMESDMYQEVLVSNDEKHKGKILSIKTIGSTGMTYRELIFLYDDEAKLSGEPYSTKVEKMLYADDGMYEGKTREIKMFNGDTEDCWTLKLDADAEVRLFSISGTFTVDGIELKANEKGIYDDDKMEKVMDILHQVDENNDYLDVPHEDGTGTLSWKPDPSVKS